MANIKSAIKRARQNKKRNILKSSQRSAVRTAVKIVENAIEKKDKKVLDCIIKFIPCFFSITHDDFILYSIRQNIEQENNST